MTGPGQNEMQGRGDVPIAAESASRERQSAEVRNNRRNRQRLSLVPKQVDCEPLPVELVVGLVGDESSFLDVLPGAANCLMITELENNGLHHAAPLQSCKYRRLHARD